jgi:hypothetical protein
MKFSPWPMLNLRLYFISMYTQWNKGWCETQYYILNHQYKNISCVASPIIIHKYMMWEYMVYSRSSFNFPLNCITKNLFKDPKKKATSHTLNGIEKIFKILSFANKSNNHSLVFPYIVCLSWSKKLWTINMKEKFETLMS